MLRGLLLDLGCGKIPLYEIYRDRISDSVCVDWPKSLHTNPNIDHEFDLNHPIPLPDGHFDTVLLTDVLEHLPNPWLLWKEISRLLKPFGKAMVGVPFLYWIHEAPYDYYRYTEHALRRFCDENGFNVVEIESYGGPVEVILDIIAKQIRSYSRLSRLHYRFSHAITEFCTHRVSDRTRRPVSSRLLRGRSTTLSNLQSHRKKSTRLRDFSALERSIPKSFLMLALLRENKSDRNGFSFAKVKAVIDGINDEPKKGAT